MIRCSQNENPCGVSPMALDALTAFAHKINLYPDMRSDGLRSALAKKHAVNTDQVMVTSGLVEMIDLLIRRFAGKGNLVTPDVTFVAYLYFAQINGIAVKKAPLKDHCIDLEGIADACDDDTGLVLLANPNNPSGTMFGHDAFATFLDRIPSRIMVAADEAYVEYVADDAYPDTLKLMERHPNLIMMRTFSKVYGLAGLRVGYGVARRRVISELIGHQGPFTVNSAAEIAACAALNDQVHVRQSVQLVVEERRRMVRLLRSIGYELPDPYGNFVYLPLEDDIHAQRAMDALTEKGILVGQMGPYGAPNALRISISDPQTNLMVIDTLRQLR